MKRILSVFMLMFIGCIYQTPINLLPMYGNMPKPPRLIALDNRFIETAVEKYVAREVASREYSDFGWTYLNRYEFDTAMKRFNQAWLLDKTNAHAYWGFAAYYQLTQPERYNEIIKYLVMAHEYEKNNYEIIRDIGKTYARQLDENANLTKSQAAECSDKAIKFLQKAIEIKPSASEVFVDLAIAYYLNGNVTKAKETINKAEALGVDSKSMSKFKRIKEELN